MISMDKIRKISSRRGLVWTTDFIIGLVLFIMVVLLSIKILSGLSSPQDHVTVYRDAVSVSENLLSGGYPLNWTNDTVILPGIAEDNRINVTKLEGFTAINYYRTKTLFHVTSDFAFFVRNATTIINATRCIYGYNLSTDENCTPSLAGIEYDTLVRIDRIVLYDSKVMTMTVYAWD